MYGVRLADDRTERAPVEITATRAAALLPGGTAFARDVPVRGLARVDGTEGLTVKSPPQDRRIVLEVDMGVADLAGDAVEGANPLVRVKVRRAVDMAIDREAGRHAVMRSRSRPVAAHRPTLGRRMGAGA